MPQKYISEMNESMKRRVASGMRENVYWVRASVIPVGVHGDLASERGNSHERKREEWLGLERSPLAATRFVSLDAEVQETQSGAQASAFAYRDERDRDRWAAPCRVTTASDFIRDDAKCTTWQR